MGGAVPGQTLGLLFPVLSRFTVWITPRSLAPKGRSTVINGASRAHFQIRKLPSIESRHVTEPILGTFAGHRLVRVAE